MRYHYESSISFLHPLSIFFGVGRALRLSEYAYLLGTRVGEAGNPGPYDYGKQVENHDTIKLAVINPTAVNGKHDDIFDVGANIYCLAETSATSIIQKQMTIEARKRGFSPKVLGVLRSAQDNHLNSIDHP